MPVKKRHHQIALPPPPRTAYPSYHEHRLQLRQAESPVSGAHLRQSPDLDAVDRVYLNDPVSPSPCRISGPQAGPQLVPVADRPPILPVLVENMLNRSGLEARHLYNHQVLAVLSVTRPICSISCRRNSLHNTHEKEIHISGQTCRTISYIHPLPRISS